MPDTQPVILERVMNFWQYLPLTPKSPLPRDCVAGRGDLPTLAHVLPFSPPRVGEGAGG
ncbi:MAG: hypothetical protein KatS3mg051_0563 [Anaerolineae bacterium]|nr:MAG: hypothetical protein KatS3mg051_0563 [Anaerolineae bacterium]